MCKTTDDNQECLATGIFEGDKSQHSILIQYYAMNYPCSSTISTFINNKNLVKMDFLFYLFEDNLIYRDSNLNDDLLIKLF